MFVYMPKSIIYLISKHILVYKLLGHFLFLLNLRCYEKKIHEVYETQTEKKNWKRLYLYITN